MSLMVILLTVLAVYSRGVHAVLKPKFNHFYPKYDYVFKDAVQRCQPELQAYHANIKTAICSTPCACAADCLLSDLTPTIQANMASANVILGLVPAILVFVGPEVGEMAVMSTWCPTLGFILALASPAINIRRVLVKVNVLDVINRQPDSAILLAWHQWRQRLTPRSALLVNILRYTAALLALANTVENSIRLDLRTVPSFRCSRVLLPLIWSLLGILIYLLAAIGVRLRRYGTRTPFSTFTGCTWQHLESGRDSLFSEGLFWTGSLTSIVVMTMGVADLSSLLFISANDAVIVLVRYLISAMVCQIIFQEELASLQFEHCQSQNKL